MKSACKNTRENLFAFSENSLPVPEKEEIENHLAECRECASLVEYFNLHVLHSALNQKITADAYFYTRVLGKLQSSVHKKFSIKHLFENRIFIYAVFVSVIVIAVLFGINIGSFERNSFLKNKEISSNVTVNQQDEYGKFSSADQMFYNQYLKLIENGNNGKKNESH